MIFPKKNLSTVIVIVYKINDYIYAQSTQEFLSARKKILFDFYGLSNNYHSEFDVIEKFEYKRDISGILKNILRILKLNIISNTNTTVISSNYQLFYTRIIACWFIHKAKLILIEDGLMNYRSASLFMKDSALENLPNGLLKILRLSQEDILRRILTGYFLCPKLVQFSINKKKLTPCRLKDTEEKTDLINRVNGKRLFIGQPLYITGEIDADFYRKIVENLYASNMFDLYVPHLREELESLRPRVPFLDVKNYDFTLEAIATELNCLKLITFSSSLAYTMPLLNKNIYSQLIITKKYNIKKILIIFKKIIPKDRLSLYFYE